MEASNFLSVLAHRDKLYQLTDYVEMAKGFFESADKKDDGEEDEKRKKKRGRGSSKQAKVLVSTESKDVKEHKKGKLKSVGRLKMTIMPDFSARLKKR
ncbi:MAG: hypothetical protein WD426_06765 [Anditalea sp.]